MPDELYCKHCGGTDVISEGYVVWDAVTQKFDFDSACDEGTDYCTTCDGESNCYWREITDLKTLAKIAIHKGDNHDHTSN